MCNHTSAIPAIARSSYVNCCFTANSSSGGDLCARSHRTPQIRYRNRDEKVAGIKCMAVLRKNVWVDKSANPATCLCSSNIRCLSAWPYIDSEQSTLIDSLSQQHSERRHWIILVKKNLTTYPNKYQIYRLLRLPSVAVTSFLIGCRSILNDRQSVWTILPNPKSNTVQLCACWRPCIP